MLTINVRNVNSAWQNGLRHIVHTGVRENSTRGSVLVMPTPVMTVYQRPQERVLFCPTRDSNPFFHLFESMWMIMGRNDATWLDTFVHDFSSRFAEADGTMHGAYGYRWRSQFNAINGTDQLSTIIEILRHQPTSRQCVLQMWSAELDLGADVKDKPCNSHCYFRVNQGWLEMTILCRSNDMIWGAYGSNAVHFSILQEYIAAALGLPVGPMYQFSNNYHVYVDVLEKMFPYDNSRHSRLSDRYKVGDCDVYRDEQNTRPSPLFQSGWNLQVLHNDLMHWAEEPTRRMMRFYSLFDGLLTPMARVHQYVRQKEWAAASAVCPQILHDDWRIATTQWVNRRLAKSEQRRLAAEQQRAEEIARDGVLDIPPTGLSASDPGAEGGCEAETASHSNGGGEAAETQRP